MQLGGAASQELLLLVAAFVLFGLIGCLEIKPRDWLRGCARCCARCYARGCACMAQQRKYSSALVGARKPSVEASRRSPRKLEEALRGSRSPRRLSTPQGFHASPRKLSSTPGSWTPCSWLRGWRCGWLRGWLRGWRCGSCCGWLLGCTCPELPVVGMRALGPSHCGRWQTLSPRRSAGSGGGGGDDGRRWRRASPVAREGARAHLRQSDDALRHSQQELRRSEQALNSAYQGARSLMPTRVDRLADSRGRDFGPKSPKAQPKGRSKDSRGRLSTVQL